MRTLVIVMLACASLVAQAPQATKAAVKPEAAKVEVQAPVTLTPQEKFQLRTAQQKLTAAQLAEQPYQERLRAANDALTAKADAIFASHKITPNDYVLCDGASGPACKGVEEGEIELRAIPKPPPEPPKPAEAAKPAEKKDAPEAKKPEAAKPPEAKKP